MENRREKQRNQCNKWRKDNKDYSLFLNRKYNLRIKYEMIAAYGGKCECCGITEKSFLTLEHKNHDGADHKRLIKSNGGHGIWRDLRKRGWPKDGYGLLCWNCNYSTKRGNICAHKTEVIEYELGLSSCLI